MFGGCSFGGKCVRGNARRKGIDMTVHTARTRFRRGHTHADRGGGSVGGGGWGGGCLGRGVDGRESAQMHTRSHGCPHTEIRIGSALPRRGAFLVAYSLDACTLARLTRTPIEPFGVFARVPDRPW